MASHNKTNLLSKPKDYSCDCRNKESCHWQNLYLVSKVTFESNLTSNSDDEKWVYFSASDLVFKERYCSYARNFIHKVSSVCTALAKYFGCWNEIMKFLVMNGKLLSKYMACILYKILIHYKHTQTPLDYLLLIRRF